MVFGVLRLAIDQTGPTTPKWWTIAALWARNRFWTIALFMGLLGRKGAGQAQAWLTGGAEPQYVTTAATKPHPGEITNLRLVGHCWAWGPQLAAL